MPITTGYALLKTCSSGLFVRILRMVGIYKRSLPVFLFLVKYSKGYNQCPGLILKLSTNRCENAPMVNPIPKFQVINVSQGCIVVIDQANVYDIARRIARKKREWARQSTLWLY